MFNTITKSLRGNGGKEKKLISLNSLGLLKPYAVLKQKDYCVYFIPK